MDSSGKDYAIDDSIVDKIAPFLERKDFLKRFAFLPMSATIYQNFLPLYAKLAFPVITLPNMVTDLTLTTFLIKP